MVVTKTKFINFSRCPRYIALEKLESSLSDIMPTYEEYEKEEQEEHLKEIFESMFQEDASDAEQMQGLLPFYNEVEHLAGVLAKNYFDGTFHYARNTKNQKYFEAEIDEIRYLCYIDIYNEAPDFDRVIEVKATTSKQYLSLGSKEKSLFHKGNDGIYEIDFSLDPKILERELSKLQNRYTPFGHYLYDLAVQRYIIEHSKEKKERRYYLAVLNSNYEFDGTYENGIPKYETNKKGEDIIVYFDFTSLTEKMMKIVEEDQKKIDRYLKKTDHSSCPIGIYCEEKKSTKCKYIPVCWDFIPKKNSIFQYLDSGHGFKDVSGSLHTAFELANQGMVSIESVPDEYLQRKKNQIQKEVVQTGKTYIQKKKILDGMKKITYPIYHLDFETFPCPLPRFKGEYPYTQSVFQFSLHIERSPGICDKESDHFGYLSKDTMDHREELIQKLCEWIDIESGGTVLVYNESFEKSRLKELADIFPKYKNSLMKIYDMVFDLLFLLKGNKKLYESLGYEEEASLFNYYHKDMNGSFSIKKILPLFSTLSYEGMGVQNGKEALITYAAFETFEKSVYHKKYQELTEYCKQDTWAMVEILDGLRKKEGSL